MSFALELELVLVLQRSALDEVEESVLSCLLSRLYDASTAGDLEPRNAHVIAHQTDPLMQGGWKLQGVIACQTRGVQGAAPPSPHHPKSQALLASAVGFSRALRAATDLLMRVSQ